MPGRTLVRCVERSDACHLPASRVAAYVGTALVRMVYDLVVAHMF